MTLLTNNIKWKLFERQRNPYYRKWASGVKGLFREDLKKMLPKIKKAQSQNDMIIAVIFTLNGSKNSWETVFKNLFNKTIKRFGNATFAELQKGKFATNDPEVMFWVENTTANEIRQIDATTKAVLQKEISKGWAEGLSNQVIASNIETLYEDQFTKSRSIRIARTETVTASNYGSMSSARQVSDRMLKYWITTPDSRTRDTHKQAGMTYGSGNAIRIDDYFIVGGVRMEYPGDPIGSASERINCRCAVGYRRKK